MMSTNSVKWDEVLLEAIHDDVSEIHALLNSNPTQPLRRAYVRAVFAAIEGTIYVLRSEILEAIAEGRYTVSRAEYSFLMEEAYSMDKTTLEARTQVKYVPIDVALRYAIKHFSAMEGVPYSVDTSTDGWRIFKSILRNRNMITHPRKASDFLVSEDLLQHARETYAWFFKECTAMYKGINECLNSEINRSEATRDEAIQSIIGEIEDAEPDNGAYR